MQVSVTWGCSAAVSASAVVVGASFDGVSTEPFVKRRSAHIASSYSWAHSVGTAAMSSPSAASAPATGAEVAGRFTVSPTHATDAGIIGTASTASTPTVAAQPMPTTHAKSAFLPPTRAMPPRYVPGSRSPD